MDSSSCRLEQIRSAFLYWQKVRRSVLSVF